MGLEKLLQINANDLDVDDLGTRAPFTETEHGASPAAAGIEKPELSEAIGAMLIIGGCIARFQGYYWEVRNKKDGRTTNVSTRGDEREWQECLAKIGNQQYRN